MSRWFQPDDEDLIQQLADARRRAIIARGKAADTREYMAKVSAESLDRVSRLMEERCIVEHRLALAKMGELP